MVQRTVTKYECDVCGEEGERYTVSYPDGILSLDRCDRHSKKLLALRDEKGSWVHHDSSRTPFKVSSVSEIQAQRRK